MGAARGAGPLAGVPVDVQGPDRLGAPLFLPFPSVELYGRRVAAVRELALNS